MTAILVVGPHRGGTSAVAGVLYHLGLFMGDKLLGPGKGNTRGHYEDLEFLKLHDQIIGNWEDPLADFEPYRAAYTALITKREAEHKLWGLKDPRLCFVFPFFADILKDTRLISVYRNAAARSLAARNDFAPEKAESITDNYHFAAYLATTSHAFHAPQMDIRYEKLIEDTATQVARLNHFIGDLATDITPAVNFIDPTLCHYR